MTILYAEHDAESEGYAYDEEVTARISNPTKENGEPTTGPLSWLNSARVTAALDDDAIHLAVSIDDPRGALVFTIRRRPDTGELLVHVPDLVPDHVRAQHVGLKAISDSTWVVVNEHNEPRTFEDDELEEDE